VTSGPAALFDLDGTVWDSLPGIITSLEHALAHVGVTPPSREALMAHVGPPILEMLADVGVPTERLHEACEVYRERYHRIGVTEAALYPGMLDLIDHLRADGWRLATATSKGEVGTALMLQHFGLTSRFDVVSAARMDATGHGKGPVIDRALEGLGRPDPAATWMIGDRSYDVDGGRSAGLRTIGVMWGYAVNGELARSMPDRLARSVTELGSILIGWGPIRDDG